MDLIDIFGMVGEWFGDMLAFADVLKGGSTKTILFFSAVMVIYVRHALKIERAMGRIEDDEKKREKRLLLKRIDEKLSVIETHLYTAVERMVYRDGTPNRRITIIRNMSEMVIPANILLRDYHSAVKQVLYKQLNDYIYFDEMYVHSVCGNPKEDHEQEQESAQSVYDKMITEIHKKVGTNEELAEAEMNGVVYEDVYSMYRSLCRYARRLRVECVERIESKESDLKLPFPPKIKWRRKK